jgi:hypothetical protein
MINIVLMVYTVIKVILNDLSDLLRPKKNWASAGKKQIPDFKMMATFLHSQPLCVDYNKIRWAHQ